MEKAPNSPDGIALVFDNYAESYLQYYLEHDLYKNAEQIFSDLVPDDAKVLDIGCGPGIFLKKLYDSGKTLKLEGIDVSPNMIALAGNNIPSGNFSIRDCRNIDVLSGPYDGIICSFCLPYLNKNETSDLIRNISKLTDENGLFYLGFIGGKYSRSGLKNSSDGKFSLRMFFYSYDQIMALLNNLGFHLQYGFIYKRLTKTNNTEIDIVLISKKGR